MKTFWSRKLRETATRWWCVCDSSGSRGKLLRCVENQLHRTRWDYHNMQISVCLYVVKVFENLRQNLRLSSCTFDAKTNILISGVLACHFGSRAISCSNVRGVFPGHERFWFCLVQKSTTQFCSFPAFSWHVWATEQMCRYLQRQLLLLILVLPIVLAPTSVVFLVSQMMRSSTPSFQCLRNSKSRSRKSLLWRIGCPAWVHISRELLVILRPDLQRWNRISSTLTARMCKFETYTASASNVSGSARSWPTLEQVDGSTAAGSHGPGSSDDNRNTRRRLDTLSSPKDEQPRSAVLLRFLCEQYHKGITKWIDNPWEESNMPACNKLVRIHCKAGSVSVRLVSETRAKCQDFLARYKDDGIP